MAVLLTCRLAKRFNSFRGQRSTHLVNMAWELKGELKFKDGRTRKFAVETESNLKSTIEGVKKINSDISVVLTELVEEQKRVESRVLDEDEEDEADEDEDADTESSAVKLKSEPPVKRLKTISPS